MNQLTITHADGTTGVYTVGDSTVLAFDGQSVALGGVTGIALSDSPAAPAAPAEQVAAEPVVAETVAITTAADAALSSVTDTIGNTYTPAAGEPAPQKASAGIVARAVAFYRWTKSPMGRKDVALVIAAANAIYIAVHRAGF